MTALAGIGFPSLCPEPSNRKPMSGFSGAKANDSRPGFCRHTRESGYPGPNALRGTLASRFRGSDDYR
jgi:hypothetical protein